MRPSIPIFFMSIMAIAFLTGCYDTGVFDEPVEVKPEQTEAMESAAQKLTGRWKQVRQGISPSNQFNLTFKEDHKVIVESHVKEETSYKLGYDWKYVNRDGKRSLQGHIYFYTPLLFNEPYVCIIESNDNNMALCPDGSTYVDDPTMYFERE